MLNAGSLLEDKRYWNKYFPFNFVSLLIVAFFFQLLTGFGQGPLETNCQNSNFNLGVFDKWDGCYGFFSNPCQTPGFLTNGQHPLHKLIPGPGWVDANTTCPTGGLTTVFPGENYVARIGDTIYYSNGGNTIPKAAKLKYAVDVTSSSYLFIYRYAVVLQSGNHPVNQQPDFDVQITDANGLLLDPVCGAYHIAAPTSGSPPPGWHQCTEVYWKDWTTVGMDLTDYFGQTVYITFQVRPCTFNTHFGYAYISAYCSALEIQIGLCSGDTEAILKAPPGFTGYEWRGPGYTGPVVGTTQTITITNPVANDFYYCNLTAVNGCVVNDLSQKISFTTIDAAYSFMVNCAERPSSFTDETTITQNEVVDWHWDFDDGSPVLTGVQNPSHVFALPGTYNVKLKSFSTEGCKDSIIHQVTIPALPSFTNSPALETQCNNLSTNITLIPNVAGSLFTWRAIPKTPQITGGTTNNVPGLLINDVLINNGSAVDTMIYRTVGHAAGLCNGDSIDFKVAVYPSPNVTNTPLNKSICDSTSTNITLTTSVPGSTYNWTCTVSSLNLSGYAPNTGTPSAIINQIVDNTGFTTEDVIYRICPKLNGCSGDSVFYTVSVKPSANLSNTPKRLIICDSTFTNITLTSQVPGADFTWTCSSAPVITGWSPSAAPGVVINQRLLNNSFITDSAIYHIIPHANGCTGHLTDFTVVVKPLPDVLVSPASQICSAQATGIALSSNMPGTTFSWAIPVCANISPIPPAGSGSMISDILNVLTTTLDGSAVYTITPHNNGCDGNNPKTHTVTVRQFPVPAIAGNSSVCEGAASQVYSTAAGMSSYTWNISPGGIITGGLNSNSIQVTWNTVGSGTTRWVEVNYVNIYGCTAIAPTVYYVTVKPIPNVVATPLSLEICSGQTAQIQLASDVPGTIVTTTFGWNSTASANVTPNILAGTGNINQVFTNSGFIFEPVQFLITPLSDGCSPAVAASYTLNVKPVPNFTTPAMAPVCSGSFTNINLLSGVAGTLFTWNSSVISGSVTGQSNSAVPGILIDDQLINTGNGDGVVRYVIIPQASGCTGISSNYDVTVHPVPLLTNSPKLKEICQGNQTDITLTSNVTGALFTWTCTQTSGNVTGWSNSAVPGILIDQVLQLGIFTLDSVIYHVTPGANGCFGPVSNFKVIVNPVPKVTNTPMHDTICSATITSVNLTATCTGTTFNWSGTPGTGSVTGFGTGNTPLIAETLTNLGNTTGSVIYTVTPHAGLCAGNDTLYTVYVYPKPNLTTTPLSTTICSGTSINIPLTSDVAIANFSWTATASSGTVSGFLPGIGLTIAQTLTNSGTTIETVTYTITPRANGCNGDSYQYVVTVNPTPHLLNTQPATICSATTLSIPLLQDVAGSTFTWTASCLPAGSVNGFTASQATGTNSITDMLTNTGNVVSTVTYLIIPHANGCAGPATGLTVPVNPTPVISCTSAQSICSGTAFTPVVINSTVAATQFSWSAACPVGSINPCPVAPGTGSPITSLNLMNVTDVQQTVTYTITSSFSGCPGTSTTHVITVNPSPTVTNWPLEQTICSGQTSSLVNLSSSVIGTTFSWTASTVAPISGFSLNGTAQIPAQTLTIPSGSTGFITYHIIPSFTGGTSCPGAPTDYKIHVNPLPTPVISGSTLVCELQPNVKYSTPSVAGHSYNWTVTGASLVINANTSEVTVTWGPYTASPGTLTVTETIDATNCQQSTSLYQVVLQQRPVPTLTGPAAVCVGSSNKIYQTETGMSNYAWSVTGGTITAGGGAGSPSATVTWNTAGLQTIEVNYTNSLNCPGYPAKQLAVTVNSLPNTSITEGPGAVCEALPHAYQVPADPLCTFIWTVTPAGRGTVSSGQGTSIISIDWQTSGTAVVTVNGTNTSTGCISSGTFPVIVNPKPATVFTPCFDLTTTPNAKKIILRGGNPALPAQGSYAGNRVSFNNGSGNYEFDPTGASAGTYPISYTYTNTFGCPASASPVSITVTNNSFFCGGKLTDVRDGRQYQTATLSGRCWMTENLSYGNILAGMPATPQTDNCVAEKYCSPADAGCTSNGGFYQWNELMDYSASTFTKGICPPEWHVPSEAEWQQLIDNLVAGIGSPNANAAVSPELKDLFLNGGFHALPGGFNYLDNTWVFNTGSLHATMYWTSSASSLERSTSRGLNIYTPSISRYSGSRSNAFPVRCIKD